MYIACALVIASASAVSVRAEEPSWFTHPPADGADFLYARGYAAKKASRLEAMDAATQEALSRFARRICVTILDDVHQATTEQTRVGRTGASDIGFEESYTRDMRAISNQQLLGTDVVYEAVEERRGRWQAWVVATYPMAQYKKALARVPELLAEQERMSQGERIRASERPVPLLVCPLAFGEQSSEQFPELVAEFKRKGYGNAIWQTVEDNLYETRRFTFVTPPSNQARSMLEQIMGRTPEVQARKLPRRILLCNMNFFEVKTERLGFGSIAHNPEYHVELMLEYYDLEDRFANVKIPAKGEARDADLLKATDLAAERALKRLVTRIDEEEG
ncbi:MAG: LPP20 family lipoprotein [Lentisphaerae bacterium]|nr:LPP20 family lipoprotein [Lentisphaerota bacterium]